MAAANPLEEILNSEVDASAISALVGSLESQLASPTSKAATQQHLTTSLHSNHNYGEQAGAPLSNAQENRISTVVVGPNTTLDQKPVLSATSNASMPPQSTNGSNELVGHPAQLLGINSIVTPGSAAALGRLTNVNTRGITPGTLSQAALAAPHSNVHRSAVGDTKPISVSGGIPKHSVVTIGSTNTGTVTFHPSNSSNVTHHINTSSPDGHPSNIVSHTNMTSTSNHLTSVMNSLAGNAMFNLANVAAEQKPLMLPMSTANDGRQQAAAAGRMTVREQIEKQQRDTSKRHHVVVNVLNPSNAQKIPQSTQKSDMLMMPAQTMPAMPAVQHMQVAASLPTATTVSTSVITITRPVSTPQTVTVVRHPSSTPSAPHQQHIQIVNMNNANASRMAVSSQKTLAPRLVPTTSIRIATPPPPVQPAPVAIRQPGNVIRSTHNTITLPPGVQLPPGAVIVKNEQGQYMVVSGQQQQQLQQQQQHIQQQQPNTSAILSQQYKFNTVRPVTSVTQPTVGGAVHQVLTMSQPMPSTLQPLCVRPGAISTGGRAPVAIATTPVNVPLVRPNVAASPQNIAGLPNAAAPTVSQPQSLENVRKCKNFLTTLIKLAASQPMDTVKNVKNLVQALIDGTVEPDQFTAKLQVELKSSPQPYLIPFLKKSLPLLRQSMCLNQIHIEGVRPPPSHTLMPSGATTLGGGIVAQPAIQQQFTLSMSQTHGKPGTPSGNKQLTPQQLQTIMHQQRLQMQASKQGGNKAVLSQPIRHPTTSQARFTATSAIASSMHREKRKFESLKEDDDINDVATMGGVNLSEESQNILATNSELMTGQLRSCLDENFLNSSPLRSKINAIARKRGLDDVPSQVVSLISHATQERLRNIIEKLANIAEHRLEIYKTNSRYEVMGEVRPQLKFLEELDRLEKKRHEEAEREVLLRAARIKDRVSLLKYLERIQNVSSHVITMSNSKKPELQFIQSRAKHEDPEQAKLKEKAKALQAAEMEEVRQREANLTALAAIGPRKKRKLEAPDTPGSSGSGSAGPSGEIGSTARSVLHRPRIKRVNQRDLLFVLEQEREMNKSTFLYKSFLK